MKARQIEKNTKHMSPFRQTCYCQSNSPDQKDPHRNSSDSSSTQQLKMPKTSSRPTFGAGQSRNVCSASQLPVHPSAWMDLQKLRFVALYRGVKDVYCLAFSMIDSCVDGFHLQQTFSQFHLHFHVFSLVLHHFPSPVLTLQWSEHLTAAQPLEYQSMLPWR